MESVRRNPLHQARTTSAALRAIAARVEAAQGRAITGIAVERPSDAPGEWSAIHALASDRDDQAVWQAGADHAQDLLDTADAALGDAGDALKQALERAVQMSNGTYATSSRTAAAGEIVSIRAALVAAANTKVGDRSLFAGDAFHGPAFDAAGTYLGGPASAAIRIGRGDDLVVAQDGGQIFAGGVDVFAVLADLEAALAADDPVAVAATLAPLQVAHDQLVGAREAVGFGQQRADDARTIAQGLSTLLEGRLSARIAADPVTSFQEFSALKTSYEAALQVTASASGASLFGMLR